MNSNLLSLTVILLCVIFSAYFSASETAFSCLSRARIKTMAENGNSKAKLVLSMSENYDTLISTILVGNNIVNILASSLTTLLLYEVLVNHPDAVTTLSTAITTIVILIFGEVGPKTIANERPEEFAMFSAPFLKFLMTVLTPVTFLFKGIKKLLAAFLKSDNSRAVTEEELLTIVEEAEQEGELDEQEGTLIRSAIEFSEQEAIDVLTPRIDIVGVPKNATKDEIAKTFAETGYSRLPIYEDSIDHITGIIYLKDFYNKIYNSKETVESIIRPALYTTQSKKVGELLKELQCKKLHIAVVLDEYGATVGIVTLEDILEELVGEIWDQHDEVTEEIVTAKENEYIVLGSTNIEEMFEELGIETEEEFDVQTVSGWVMDKLGHIPNVGDTFESNNLLVTVTEMDERRVDKIKVVFTSKEECTKQSL